MLVGLATVTTPQAQAAGDGFTAGGSARQVYAVGLPGGAPATCSTRGDVVKRQRAANQQGGVLFRKVKPRHGLPGAARTAPATPPAG